MHRPKRVGKCLQAAAGNRPQVQALLRFLPAAQTGGGPTRTFTVGGQSFSVPTGSITGSASSFFDNHQASFRVDHRFNDANSFDWRAIFTTMATPAEPGR